MLTEWFDSDVEYEVLQHTNWLETTKVTPRHSENFGGYH